MIAAVLNGSKEDFESSFSDSLKDRIADNLAVVHHAIAKDIVKTNHTSEKNEAFIASLTFDENEKEVILDDKISIILNKGEAKSLIDLFENLNEDNQNTMIESLFTTEQTFKDILEVSRGKK